MRVYVCACTHAVFLFHYLYYGARATYPIDTEEKDDP